MKNNMLTGLIGNPNTGKTSLMNSLAGLYLHVGNWPGKTVDKKETEIEFQGKKIRIVDLPGTYSIAPYSEEEKVARDFIYSEKPDVIIQTVDVNTLERNLLMTLELLAMNRKVILAFNFNKEAERRGVEIKKKELKDFLQVPIVEIEANTGEGKEKLLQEVVRASSQQFHRPTFLPALMENEQEISHAKAIDFLRKNISHNFFKNAPHKLTQKIDVLALHKFWGFPFLFLVVYLMFKVTFTLSAPLVAAIESIFSALASSISVGSLPSLAASLLKDGIIGGIGSVVVFVPLIFILFLVIAILEDSGYLSRAVVLTDRIFQRFGITGRSLIPMILGFGCNVPAIMSGRTIKQEKERKIAMFVNPFISCSARLPVYLLIASIFFPGHSTLAVFSLYILGVVIAFLVSYVYSKISGKAEEAGMIIELPPYRRPNIKNVLRSGWNNTYLFLKKAGTLILVASLAVWLLASLPVGVEYGGEASLLGIIGKKISFLFDPLGFGHWAFAVSLLFGVIAKETIISTLGALFGVGEKGLAAALPQIIDTPGALAFLCFVLLYIPCLATIATVKKETGSWRFVFSQILVTFIVAWIVAYIVNQVAGWLI